MYSQLFRLVVVASMLLVVGCSESTQESTVGGLVTFEDQPLTSGRILFQDEAKEGNVFIGNIDGAGHYEMMESETVKGIPAGRYRVSVKAEETPTMDPTGKPSKVVSPIPKKFADVNTSGLTAEVKTGKNEFNFPLK